jgi:flavin-dependent dehydrogenase
MYSVKIFLNKNYQFDNNQKPIWRDSCLQPILCREFKSSDFLLAKGNALLVGDAGGFPLPGRGEGIGTAIKSGLLAGHSIMKAIELDETADGIYLNEIKGIISVLNEISSWVKRIREETKSGGHSLPEVLEKAYRSTLKMF